MDSLHSLFPKNLYHSYIVEGTPEVLVFSLQKMLQERGDIEMHSADVLCQVYEAFSVDDSKKIKEWHSEKALGSAKRVCIIGAKFINHDAERTLLKILEEPQPGTHFFIVVPNKSLLLDTILSRAHVVRVDEESGSTSEKSAQEFFNARPKQRIDLVAELIDLHKDSTGSGSLRYSAMHLINDLEKIIYERFKKNMSDGNAQFKLHELALAREYVSLPGASVKMILEHISLVL